jgi:hypothetical protein
MTGATADVVIMWMWMWQKCCSDDTFATSTFTSTFTTRLLAVAAVAVGLPSRGCRRQRCGTKRPTGRHGRVADTRGVGRQTFLRSTRWPWQLPRDLNSTADSHDRFDASVLVVMTSGDPLLALALRSVGKRGVQFDEVRSSFFLASSVDRDDADEAGADF